MVIVTHEVGFAQQVASRLIFIDKGRIAEDGDPHTLITNPPSERLREFYSTSPDAPQAGSPACFTAAALSLCSFRFPVSLC